MQSEKRRRFKANPFTIMVTRYVQIVTALLFPKCNVGNAALHFVRISMLWGSFCIRHIQILFSFVKTSIIQSGFAGTNMKHV